MVPPTSTTDTNTTRADEFTARRFDFIVVGGGTAGLVVAARLAENSALTVGVLEAGAAVGEDGKDDEGNIRIPGCFGQTLGGRHDWQFETVTQPGLGGRQLPWPRGKVLGGTSVLNFMTWNRASREDYDAWEALGNPGWGWDSLLSVVTFNVFSPLWLLVARTTYQIAHNPLPLTGPALNNRKHSTPLLPRFETGTLLPMTLPHLATRAPSTSPIAESSRPRMGSGTRR